MNKGLAFKLCRFGKKRQPIFRIGVLPVFRSPNKKYGLEFVGHYNPRTKEFKVDEAKVKDYLTRGTFMTNTVKSLFIKNGILPKDDLFKESTENSKSKNEGKA
jgi:small subunit ribosomal protein S16